MDTNQAAPRRAPVTAASITALIVLLFVAAALAALASFGASGWPSLGERALWSAVRFTSLQASLSTLLSVVLAIPIARALARRSSFPGRSAIIGLLSIPLALPALVAVLGLVAVYGRTGWLAQLAAALGHTDPPNIYGLTGIQKLNARQRAQKLPLS